MKTIILISLLIIAAACTDNQKARKFGGTEEIRLPTGEKLIVATWKESNLWYLTEPMPEGYQPQTKIFRESSNYGVWNGSVKFIESR
jgi:hypothetical protein